MPRRLLAPTTDGGILADPGFDAVPELVEANRRSLDRTDIRIGGIALRELRQRARQEIPQAAGSPADGPLLVSGHQPELSHPGVWIKNFALHGLAAKLRGVPLHLIVDNDTMKSTALRVPAFTSRDPASVHRESVRFDASANERPYEDRAVLDPELFRTFPQRVGESTQNWGFEPLLMRVWRSGTNVGETFTAMRRECERAWGCTNRELPVSRLAGTESFRQFASHILDDLPRFRECYNAAIRDYRQINGVRSANHPAPLLAADEAPFWVRSGAEARERATARSDVQNLRPRALTLTLFVRLCLADFFIHGIGGGKYDEVTDAIIRSYFGIEPPAYQVLSATLYLPLPGFAATVEEARQARRLLRDLHWNPQRYVAANELADREVLRRIADRIDLASDEPPRRNRRARREWFRRLQESTAALRPLVAPQREAARAEWHRLEVESQANTILRRRDYAWVLYPEKTLKPFLQRFL